MEEQPLISACFPEACSARYLFNHLTKEVGNVTIFFQPKKIVISVRNIEGYATIETVINPTDLESYEYNVRTPRGELAPFHPIVVNSTKLMLATKTITKKDGLMMIVYPDCQSFYIQTLTGRKGGPITMIPIVDSQTPHMIYALPEFQRSDDEANVGMSAKSFSEMCTSMSMTKCSRVEFLLYEAGVIFAGYGIDGSKIRTEDHGVCDPDAEPAVINVPIKTIKSLGKINVFSNNGSRIRIVHQLVRDDYMMKIVSPIGNYGTYTILLRSVPAPKHAAPRDDLPLC